MDLFFQQIYTLITSDTGTLTYQLILAFSITGALMAALSHWRTSDIRQVRRLAIGLSILLLLRMAVFVVAGLVWQDLILGEMVLPVLNRGVTLLSLVIIIWLWAFPEPLRSADVATIIVGLLVLTLTVFGAIWWLNLGTENGFNGSLPGRAGEITALILIAAGCRILLLRRPDGWTMGLLMIIILGVGHLVQLLFPPPGGDYSGVVRLTQMVAYPLLFLLPQRLPAAELSLPESADGLDGEEVDAASFPLGGLSEGLGANFLELLSATSSDQTCRLIAAIITQYMDADVCLLTLPEAESDQVRVKCGYDLRLGNTLPGLVLYQQQFPLITDAIRQAGAVRLPTSSASPDVANLSHFYNFKKVGHLLSMSVLSSDGALLMGVILLLPYSDRYWSLDDEAKIASLAPALARFLHHNQQYFSLQEQALQMRQDLSVLKERERQLRDERQKFQDFLELFTQKLVLEQELIAILAAKKFKRAETQETVSKLRDENEDLKQFVRLAEELPPVKQALDLEDELHLVNEEVILLQAALSEAEETVMVLKAKSISGQLSEQQQSMVVSITRELRGSATSISEYARFLLTESLGELDTVQRKILLRIQRDAERVNNLIVELINTISKASGVLDRAHQGVHISEVIDQAVAGSEQLYREKEILLSLDIQDDLPVMYVERDLLQTVINTFLQHGAFMVPYGGQAHLRLTPTSEDKGREFIELHLADESLLSKEVLPDFLTTPGGDPMLDSGLGEDRWKVLETLVDELQGRVWMAIETGRPASINLALPVVQSTEAAKFDVRDG